MGCREPVAHSLDASVDGSVIACDESTDADGDTLSDAVEGSGDADGDNVPNYLDLDSDGDGWSDAEEAGDFNCGTEAVDTDSDGIPDFLDLDANGDAVPDREQPGDQDGDGLPDRLDLDVDGDGIDNAIELDSEGEHVDTDADGVPDVLDTDSDNDLIADLHEGARDPDGDGVPNYRDLDSDGDGIDDRTEAGDDDLETGPVSCPREVEGSTGVLRSDGHADFVDTDSDNDGWSDSDENASGTDRCAVDTDGDGQGDLAEGVYARLHCPTTVGCDCANDSTCQIPTDVFYLVLPFGGPELTRELTFGTRAQSADIFFLIDTTSSMAAPLRRITDTLARPDSGLVARLEQSLNDVYVGGGSFQDFAIGAYGGVGDEPFVLASSMMPASRADEVASEFAALSARGGGDEPEAHDEALYQVLAGVGGRFSGGGREVTIAAHGDSCLGQSFGAPCFRARALPIVVAFTDTCAHGGPPGEDASACGAYEGIAPASHSWSEAVAAMNEKNARFIGISTLGGCAEEPDRRGGSPCYWLSQTARETSSVDHEGAPLVYDLPAGGATDAEFIATVVGAVQSAVDRVPTDVDTLLNDDRSDPEGVDATRFIKARRPACRDPAPAPTCWRAPEGLRHEEAVGSLNDSTFFDVIPNTEITFQLVFQNDFVAPETTARAFLATIVIRGGGLTVLDTRTMLVIVPADAHGPLG